MSEKLVVMLGFDCDRPRGDFAFTEEGSKMADVKMNSIEHISKELEELNLPRTFFICGQFLESLEKRFGKSRVKNGFCIDSDLVEIGDHTYSHSVVKKIPTRPDKIPMSPNKFTEEYEKNSELFENIFDMELKKRGFRTPLGHFNGLTGEDELLSKLKEVNIKYVSSDLRDHNDSLNPPLINYDNSPRQPYRYENGMLEIPAMGWQDTVFSGNTKTPLYETPPKSYEEIIDFFESLFSKAKKISEKTQKEYFLGLTLHPYDNAFYNKERKFFFDVKKLVEDVEGKFFTYEEVSKYF